MPLTLDRSHPADVLCDRRGNWYNHRASIPCRKYAEGEGMRASLCVTESPQLVALKALDEAGAMNVEIVTTSDAVRLLYKHNDEQDCPFESGTRVWTTPRTASINWSAELYTIAKCIAEAQAGVTTEFRDQVYADACAFAATHD